MSAAQLRIDDQPWVAQGGVQRFRASATQSRKQLLALSLGICLLAADIALVAGAFMVAYLARFWSDDQSPALGFDRFLFLAVVGAVLTATLLATHGLYDVDRPQSWSVRLRSIASSVSTALVLSVTLSYFLGDQAFSRLWLACGWLLSIVVLGIWRMLAARLYTFLRDRFTPSNRVLIVGANRLGFELAKELNTLHVVGFVDNGSDLENLELPLLGPIAQLDDVIQAYAVDEVIVALPANRREQLSRVLARGFRRHVQVKLLPELDPLLQGKFEVQELAGRRYIGFMPVAAVSWAKRVLDLVLVGGGLLLVAPILGLIALVIKLDSTGPVFYRQERVGKDGRHFWMFKFRSMCIDADRQLSALREQNEASGPLFKMRRDPRVTRVGGFLRRWSLDELPQLLNVVRGEMSLVGPRPPLPSEVEQYEDWQMGRLRAVPGLTGLWQVSGRSEVPFHDMVRLDLHYIRNWSLSLDLEIILRTIPAVLTNRGAY